MDWFQIGKEVCQGCILSPCLFNLYAEYNMWNARLDEAQAGIKIAGRNINNLRYADDTTLIAESEEELKGLLMKVKEESEKAGLLNIPKTKIMASGPITSWQIDGETMETVTNFIFLGSKITADGDCSHEIKRRLLLGRKAMTNLDSILKSRYITLLTKVPSSQSYGFSSSRVWLWELDYKESWVLKNWCFWTVVLEKTLDSPLACKEIQSVNPKVSIEDSLEGLMLKLKLQYFGHLIRRADSLEKTMILGKIEGGRRRGVEQRMRFGWHHQLDGHEFEQALGDGEGQGSLVRCSPWGHRVRHDWATELNWFKGLEQKEYVLICFGISSFPQTLIRTSPAHPPQCKTKGERKFSKNSLAQICWMALLPKCEMPTSGFYIQ